MSLLGFALALRRIAVLAFLFSPGLVWAQALVDPERNEEKTPMHWGSDRSRYFKKQEFVELRGNAFINRPFEVLHADEIDLDLKTDIASARGRVWYHYQDMIIRADSMRVNLKTKMGFFTNGSLSDGSFSLRGTHIEQLGEKRYFVRNFDYTTCHDCPNAWEMTGETMNLTVGGYAYMEDFVMKVKDASLFWLPYLAIPIKTDRETGLLFPKLSFGQVYGSGFVQPLYLNLNSWSDMTVGFGRYSERGPRLEWEGRYVLTPRSRGNLNWNWIQDSSVQGLSSRWSGRASVVQELPWNIVSKLRVQEVSDSGYPILYADDIQGRNLPVLPSDLSFSKNETNFSSILSFRRFRNLLFFQDLNGKPTFRPGFDGRTVQELPRITLSTNDQKIWGDSWYGSVEARFSRFTRSAGPFDYFANKQGGDDEIVREANRFTLLPKVYRTLRPLPWLSVVPSLQYRSFFYNFPTIYPNLFRGYLLAQADANFQIEKTYQFSKGEQYKHTIRPEFQYSIIPMVQASSTHPFVSQVQGIARPGQYFDNWDIVPIDTSQNLETYFTPLGHSLTYGVTTQWLKKNSLSTTSTSRATRKIEAWAKQTLDIREAGRLLQDPKNDDRIVLSPFFSNLNVTENRFSLDVNYIYYSFLERYKEANLLPFVSKHRVNTSLRYTHEAGLRDGLLLYERSFGINYSYSKLTAKVSNLSFDARFSINDYIMPTAALVYDLINKNPNGPLLRALYGLIIQNPSKCWRVLATSEVSPDRGTNYTLAFELNITGKSFGAMSQDQLQRR